MTRKAYTNAAEWFSKQSFHPVAEAQAEADRLRRARAVETVLRTYDEQITAIDQQLAALSGGAQ